MSAAYVDVVEDWGARLLSTFYEQFKGQPNLTALAHDVCGPQFDALEASAQALLTLTSIDDSSGTQLDRLGVLLGQPRGGLDDGTYRYALKARVKSNKSSGSVEDIYAVFVALLGTGVPLKYTPGSPVATGTPGQASFELRANAAISPLAASVAPGLLRDSKLAGARAIFEWQEQTDAQTFFTANGAGLISSSSGGATSLNVDAPSFPASGSVLIDEGLATAETATYTVTDSTHIAVSSLSFAHAIGASVEVVGDAGQGFALAGGLSVASFPTNTTLVLQETSGFPSSGQVIVDPGMPNAETLSYSSITGGTTLNLTGGNVTQSHDIGAAVQVVGTNTGGALSNALQAA